MLKIYYAHPVSTYGTKQEARDLETLQLLGVEVLNPNGGNHDKEYKRQGMSYFTRIISDCDGLAFRGYADGAIPAGVAQEIVAAQAAEKIVFELPSAIHRRSLDVDETREYLSQCGNR